MKNDSIAEDKTKAATFGVPTEESERYKKVEGSTIQEIQLNTKGGKAEEVPNGVH